MKRAILESPFTIHRIRILAKTRADDPRMPSVETALHAVCLSQENVNFVGHSHPTAINAITCSRQFEDSLSERLFPDEIVVCGARSLLIRYVDPGLELAKIVSLEMDKFVSENGIHPKTIYLQNHGFIAMGTNIAQVKAITAMAIKSARIRMGAQSFGGINPMSAQDVDRIQNRTDEHYRQKIIDQECE